MRHRLAGKSLSRTSSHRKAMRRNLAASVIEHGTVRTTVTKAKEVRPFLERLITIARRGTLHARRQVIAMLQDRAMVDKSNPEELSEQTVVEKLFNEVAPRYADRPGGYTRIIHLPERRIGDAGRQVLLQLVEESSTGGRGEGGGRASRRRRRAARRAEAAAKVAEGAAAQSPKPPDQGEDSASAQAGEEPPAGGEDAVENDQPQDTDQQDKPAE